MIRNGENFDRSASRVTIVTVCHNSASVLANMLANCPSNADVILVDNASQDLERIQSLARMYGARVIANKKNKGFGAACNQGAFFAKTEFIFFLNPDTQLASDTLDLLITAADEYKDASAFNPRIQRTDGHESFNYKSDLLPRSKWMSRGWPTSDCDVNILSGAAFFVRRAAFMDVGGFDIKIFLYYEDDDLSLRLKKTCGQLMFCRDALVIHVEGGSSGARTAENEAFKAWHKGYSKIYTMRKHARPLARTRTIAHALKKTLSLKLLSSKLRRSHSIAFLKGTLRASFTAWRQL
jgi:N-acetylglucosaminyl-diphospho-decaprenol L-rhamnosyltransferase